MPDILHIVVTSLVLMGAAFVIGAIGFGFGLTTSPILLLVLDPQTVVVVINAVAIIAFSLVLVETREHLRNRELAPMAVAAVLGTPIGVFALSTLDASVLRIAIGALVLVLTAMVVFNAEWKVPYPRISGPALGFISSASTTGLAIGGPILVLFFLGRRMDRQNVRASMAFFFTIMYVTAAIGYAIQGLFTSERLVLIVAAAPMVAIGYWIAMKLTGRMNEGVFRAAVIGVVVISSIAVIVRELWATFV
ncbi:MAG: sulfite exporter TauE/SafE family protein [Chloroflexi bacterium]|nr:sulfite exporter TauE/SafE family protein [Chloroflexota bacterium]MYF79178.1 sulfite exporter TauE/SafE family protein [Chloroflexota bacterium]MYK61451.1 sulfite exporter TauE/SafE family protein [Chloroflexota bacterium]